MKTFLRISDTRLTIEGNNSFFYRFSVVFLILLLFWGNNVLISQTTWDGSSSSDWNTAANWSAGVPMSDDPVTIPGGMPNQPTIGAAGAVASFVWVQNGSVLTIASIGALTINTSVTRSIYNNGTIENSGTINIGQTSGGGTYGISIESGGIFNNNTGGVIKIDRSVQSGLANIMGTFTNLGTIIIGALASPGAIGLYNSSTFNNNPSGIINIDNSTESGIENFFNTFTNSGTINIGKISSAGFQGIRNKGIFNNNNNGAIKIDRLLIYGIYNSETFNNSANITIGEISSAGNYGIINTSIFNNNTGGAIKIDRATLLGINNNPGTFNNQASITIGAMVPMTNLIASINGSFSNNTGGILKGTGRISGTPWFTNSGGTLSPGYSPGILTFVGHEGFTSNIMAIEVNGKTTAGIDFDQVFVVGTSTIGGTLALNINFPNAVAGDQVPIFVSDHRIGTFTTVTGLPPTWSLIYTNTSVLLNFAGPLPVDLVSFNGKEKENSAILEWRTSRELNNKGFHVERSSNLHRWSEIGFVVGNQTTTESSKYSFLDEKPMLGTNYYRIRQIDLNGKGNFSKVISIDFSPSLEYGNLSIFPNPVNGNKLTLFLSENLEQEVIVSLFNLTGQLMHNEKVVTGTNLLDVSSLPSGIYLLRASSAITGQLVLTKQVVVYK